MHTAGLPSRYHSALQYCTIQCRNLLMGEGLALSLLLSSFASMSFIILAVAYSNRPLSSLLYILHKHTDVSAYKSQCGSWHAKMIPWSHSHCSVHLRQSATAWSLYNSLYTSKSCTSQVLRRKFSIAGQNATLSKRFVVSHLEKGLLQVIPVSVAQLLKGGGHEYSTCHAAVLLCLNELVQQQVSQVVVSKVVGAYCCLQQKHCVLCPAAPACQPDTARRGTAVRRFCSADAENWLPSNS